MRRESGPKLALGWKVTMRDPILRRLQDLGRQLRADERGGLSAEYVVITAIGLGVALGLGVLGASMVNGYGESLQRLYSEYP